MTSEKVPQGPGRLRRQRKWFALTCIGLSGLALVVGEYYYAAYQAEKRLAAVMAACDRQDPNWR
ncbi:MAG TPA: hypothetical protein VKI17_02535, partial [Gemmataceae bacterium]|nr:hypothetical protein [Gemmataceae bacterium]